MLKITKLSTPITVKNIVLCIYSLPGLGKTSLSFTANRPLLLDSDKGSHRAKNRKDTVQIASWADVAEIEQDDLADYDTITVDTVGRMLDFLSMDIISANPKHGYMGNLSLQGYGVLKGRFTGWLNAMRTFGKDVILISHMEEKQEGDVTKERFDIQGGSRSEVYKSADAICKLYIDGKLRKLDFNPREGSLGKNPAQLGILTVPDYTKEPLYLAGVIQSIKDSINQLSEAQTKEVKEIEDWKNYFHGCKTAKEYNDAMQLVIDRKASEVVKALLWSKAKDGGLKFEEAMQFYLSETPKPVETPAEEEPRKALTDALDASLAACDAEAERKAKSGLDLPADESMGADDGAVAASRSQSPPSGKNDAFMPVEYVDPDKSRCPECNSSFGVHLVKCSQFSRPEAKKEALPKDCARYTGVLKDAKAPMKGKKFGTALMCWSEDGMPIECPVFIWDKKVQEQAIQVESGEVSAVLKRTVKEKDGEEHVYYSLESFEPVEAGLFA